jgi:hypothetical protein
MISSFGIQGADRIVGPAIAVAPAARRRGHHWIDLQLMLSIGCE